MNQDLPAVRLEPMTWDEFDVWSERSVRGFVAQQVGAGLQPEPEATDFARRQLDVLLPAGLATPLHHLWTVRPAGSEETVLGGLWMRVRPLSVEVEAYVFDIDLVPEARGRGLGRATLLAAERAARGLGADVVRLNVFGHNHVAMRLYDSLGYDVAGTTMTRRLDPGAPAVTATGPRVALREMTGAEFDVVRPRLEADHAAALARSGALPEREARHRAADDLARLLHHGPASPGQLLRTAYDGPERVGHVWVQVQERSDGLHAQAHAIAVRLDRRRRGYGESLLAAAERMLQGLGVTSVALWVAGSDTGAQAFHARHGFEVTAQTRAKRL